MQAVRRRRTWFVLFRSGMLPETKRICLGTIPFGAFPRPKLTGKILPPAFRHTLWEHAKRAWRQKRQPIPSGLEGTAPLRRAFGLVFRFILVVFFVACAWLRRAQRAALVYATHTPWCQNQNSIIFYHFYNLTLKEH